MDEKSPSEVEIIRDISRTFPNHIHYHQRHGLGQRQLYNVLKAYSVYDRQACRPFDVRQTLFDIRYTTDSPAAASAIYDMYYSIYYLQLTIYDIRHSIYDIRSTYLSLLPRYALFDMRSTGSPLLPRYALYAT